MFEKVDWDRFEEMCKESVAIVDENQDIATLNESLCAEILEAASESIQNSRRKMLGKAVPWWTHKFGRTVRDRNRAIRLLKRMHLIITI